MNERRLPDVIKKKEQQDSFDYLSAPRVSRASKNRFGVKGDSNLNSRKLLVYRLEWVVRWSMLGPFILFCVFIFAFRHTDNQVIIIVKLITGVLLIIQVFLWWLLFQMLTFRQSVEERGFFKTLAVAVYGGVLAVSFTGLITNLLLTGYYSPYEQLQEIWLEYSCYGLVVAGLMYSVQWAYSKFTRKEIDW